MCVLSVFEFRLTNITIFDTKCTPIQKNQHHQLLLTSLNAPEDNSCRIFSGPEGKSLA